MTAKKRAAKTTSKAKPARPGVPGDWDDDTSVVHWFPDEEVRAQVRTLAKQAAAAPKPKQAKAWKDLARLFPPGLAQWIKASPWRWGNTVSPEVAEVAIDLIAYAAEAGDSEVDEVIESIERILPDSPGACMLDEIGGPRAFEDAVEKVRARLATLPMDGKRHRALTSLLDYIWDS
jgi:hypothetical protein